VLDHATRVHAQRCARRWCELSAISVTVDVAADASSPLTTVATVSNAGDANAANDVAPDVVDVGRHLRRRRLLLRRFPLRPSLALRYRFRRWTNGR
jgi:hypothetical protein